MFVRACGKFAIRKRLDQFILRKKSNTQNLLLGCLCNFQRGEEVSTENCGCISNFVRCKYCRLQFFSGC